MNHLHLHLHERAVLIRDGEAVRALGPGRYTLWKRYEVVKLDTDKLTFTAPTAVLAALPPTWFETVALAHGQYGIVEKDERPVAFLRAGLHRLWKVDPDVRVRVFAETDPLPPLTDELKQLMPAGEWLDVHLELDQRAVLLRDGVPR